MTVCYLLHTDKMITLGPDPGMAEFVLLEEMIKGESRNLGLGTEPCLEQMACCGHSWHMNVPEERRCC